MFSCNKLLKNIVLQYFHVDGAGEAIVKTLIFFSLKKSDVSTIKAEWKVRHHGARLKQ